MKSPADPIVARNHASAGRYALLEMHGGIDVAHVDLPTWADIEKVAIGESVDGQIELDLAICPHVFGGVVAGQRITMSSGPWMFRLRITSTRHDAASHRLHLTVSGEREE